MKHINNTQKTVMKSLFAFTLAFIKIQYLPSFDLLAILFFAMIVDFLTGVWKAKVLGNARTSSGYKQTVTKFMQYAGAIIGGAVLAYMGEQKGGEEWKFVFNWANDGLVFFIIYIEITSVFENLYAIDPNSRISQFFYQPAIKLLTFQFKNNPIIKKADALKEEVIQNQ